MVWIGLKFNASSSRFEWENGAMFEHDQWVCLFRCFTSEFWMLDVFFWALFHYVTVISIGTRTA